MLEAKQGPGVREGRRLSFWRSKVRSRVPGVDITAAAPGTCLDVWICDRKGAPVAYLAIKYGFALFCRKHVPGYS
jgi:hypothetical protein